jgi:hypothetical protein
MVKRTEHFKEPVIYREGDKILLSTKIKKPNGPTKLQERFEGPYTIEEVLSPTTVKLNFPKDQVRRIRSSTLVS